jgi:hypothetical protein
MNPRRVGILLVAGVLVIAIALWLSSQRHLERAITSGQAVLPDLRSSLNSVQEVRLIKGDGTKTTLKKGESGWQVAEREYPADAGRVRKLLLDIADLKVVEEKTRDPANYSKLGVEDVTAPNAGGVKVEIADGKKPVDLIVGKPSGMKAAYVRVPGAPQSLLAAPQVTVDADPKRWLDRTLFEIPQDRVKEVAVTPGTGPAYTVTREKKDQADFTIPNLPKGRALASTSSPNPIAGALTGLTLDDVRKAAPGDAPSKAVFQTFDGLTVEAVGRKDGERHLVSFTAKSTAKETEAEAKKINDRVQGWEVEIPSYKYDVIFRPLEDSLAKVEEPAAKGAKDKKKAAS